MTRQRLAAMVLAVMVLGFIALGAFVKLNPDLIGEMAVLGMLAGAIAGSVARVKP